MRIFIHGSIFMNDKEQEKIYQALTMIFKELFTISDRFDKYETLLQDHQKVLLDLLKEYKTIKEIENKFFK